LIILVFDLKIINKIIYMDNENNNHSMVTRSKKNLEEKIENKPEDNYKLEIDEHGNVSELIDYECNESFDNDMLQIELNRLRGNNKKNNINTSPKFTISPNKKKITKRKKGDKLSELFVSYLIMNMISNNNLNINKKKKRKRINDSNTEALLYDIKADETSNIAFSIEEEEEEGKNDNLSLKDSSDSDSDDDYSYCTEGSDIEFEDDEILYSSEESDDGDEYDQQYVELTENSMDEDGDYDYFRNLSKDKKIRHLEHLEQIKEINRSNIPMKFKILESNMDLRTKSIAINNIEKLSEMDVSTGEYCKMDKWINGLIKIPFGEHVKLPIDNNSNIEDTRKYLFETQKILDKAIYGHKEAKMHILQVLGKWIKNPSSLGNVLALQGPMGNGKTTLVKEGIAKAINRPFAFIALGGASDSAFFDGHSYTYEGSHWGRIIDILIESKCMNPVIYFDELDKVSDTHKGEEIIHLLTHLTDPSQNSLFQDNYFPGIQLDLSKVLFIFSFNDESRVNRILKDRMYVINTKGFKPDDKISICNDYILPELLETFKFNKDEIIFDNDSLLYIIEKYTEKEEGVRNLKRCLETIISKINIYYLSQNGIDDENEKIPLTFEIKEFNLPLKISKEIVEELIKPREDNYKPPEHMYM
tara:strand:- start:1516 stop:3447 length:1932 start_codon:yes stop_codon:yes gene_type:complete